VAAHSFAVDAIGDRSVAWLSDNLGRLFESIDGSFWPTS
jgi:hypothetical protein